MSDDDSNLFYFSYSLSVVLFLFLILFTSAMFLYHWNKINVLT